MRWRLLLVMPLVAVLIGPLYAGRRPELVGVAFFYWYELGCLLVSAAVAFIVFPPEPVRARPVEEPRFSRDPSIQRRPSRTFTRAG